jgi:hypothetical protein
VADPNWLYSSIAQSSAAIVAIIGGFITSSVLTRSSEKRSLAKNCEAAKNRLALLDEQVEDQRKLYETMKVDRFIRAEKRELGELDNWPPPDEIVKKYPRWDLDVQLVKREVEKLTKESLAARDLINLFEDGIPADYTRFDAWIASRGVSIEGHNHEFLEKEYERLRDQKREI